MNRVLVSVGMESWKEFVGACATALVVGCIGAVIILGFLFGMGFLMLLLAGSR